MLILIKKTFLILLPVMAVALGFELAARKIPTTYGAKLAAFNKKKHAIEILVLGSSHSNFGINPQYFGREAFNLSNTSQGLYQDYKLLLRFLPEFGNLKTVIIPISYFSLQSDLAKTPEAWRCGYYSYYMGVQADTSSATFDLRNHSALFLWDGPLKVLSGIRKVKKMDINEYGYQAPEPSKKSINEIINDDAGKKRVAYHDQLMDPSVIQSNMRALEDMVGELNKRNIKAVFVTTPVYKTYHDHISADNYRIMTEAIETLTSKYSLKYHNYFYDSRFTLSDFLDNDHLNEEGAKKFSGILKNEVLGTRL